MPTRARLFALCAASLTLILSGCASERLAATAPPGVRLSGNWALDPAASESIALAVAHLQAEISKIAHAHRVRSGGGFTTNGAHRIRREGEGTEARGGEREQRTESSTEALPAAPGSALVQEFLSNVPADQLTIAVTPAVMTVVAANSSQQYTTGVQTAIAWGQISAEQFSGWRGRRYIIDTRPQWGPVLTQSYSLAPNGELVVALTLRGSGIDASLTRRYRRTKRAPPALLPTSD